MDRETKCILRKVAMDCICLFIVGFPILLFNLFGVPYKRGFFCDDESLMHPFRDSTITSSMLYVVGLLVPIIVIMFIEYIHFNRANVQEGKQFLGRKIHPWVWNCYKVIGVFGFAVASSHLTTDIAKYCIGRLRPHFFAICNPNVNCTDPKNLNVYHVDFECQNIADPHRLKEIRLSFPSGHSSFSAVTMVYLAIYLQARMTWRGSKLLRHFIQYLCLMVAWGTGLSRISDYKHHWSDVLVGSAQGALVAVLVASRRDQVCEIASSKSRLLTLLCGLGLGGSAFRAVLVKSFVKNKYARPHKIANSDTALAVSATFVVWLNAQTFTMAVYVSDLFSPKRFQLTVKDDTDPPSRQSVNNVATNHIC